ncbi:MAG: hypothetical protein ACM3ML_30460 [Micromonosporaceae bacterium]
MPGMRVTLDAAMRARDISRPRPAPGAHDTAPDRERAASATASATASAAARLAGQQTDAAGMTASGFGALGDAPPPSAGSQIPTALPDTGEPTSDGREPLPGAAGPRGTTAAGRGSTGRGSTGRGSTGRGSTGRGSAKPTSQAKPAQPGKGTGSGAGAQEAARPTRRTPRRRRRRRGH